MTPSEPEAHSSIVGGSSAARLIACPGSYQLLQLLPETVKNDSSEYADEGTALHEAMAYILTQGIEDLDEIRGMTFGVSDSAPAGYVMTDDLIDGALAPCLDFFDALADELTAADGDFQFLIENRCQMPGIPGSFGTADIIFRTPKRSGIVDWKFGVGVPVKAVYFDRDGVENVNAQLRYYARAGAFTFPHMFETAPDWPVELYIVQPRGRDTDPDAPFTTTTVTVKQLEQFRFELVAAVAEAQGENPRVVGGPHCKFQACRAVCPRHTGAAADLVAMDAKLKAHRRGILQGVDINWGVAYGELLQLCELAEEIVKEVRAQAHAFMDQGHAIVAEDGSQLYKLVPKRATEKYVDEPGAVKMAMDKFGLTHEDVTEPAVTKSPAQLRAAIADKLPGKTKKAREEAAKKLLADYTANVSSGTTIAPAADGRREYIPTAGIIADLSQKLAALTRIQ